MNRRHSVACVISLLVASLPATQVAGADKVMVKSASQSSPALTGSVVWYDGPTERKAWIRPDVIAGFGVAGTDKSVVQSADANARAVESSRKSLALWEVARVDDTLKSLKQGTTGGRFSPVFHDGPTSEAPMRALPGNIIVTFKPGWTDAQVAQWVAEHKLQIVRRLNIAGHVYVFKTGPGMESLETANAIFKSGDVARAIPNWWRDYGPQ